MTTSHKSITSFIATLFFVFSFSACQEKSVEESSTTATEPQTESLVTEEIEKRPAPTFYVLNEDLVRKRVWILEDGQSDIFHVKHDCPLLVEGKGKGTFRNVTIARAIEDYGRYNCQVCSKDLDHIFDEDLVR